MDINVDLRAILKPQYIKLDKYYKDKKFPQKQLPNAMKKFELFNTRTKDGGDILLLSSFTLKQLMITKASVGCG